MREIKFRAWDERHKCYEEVHDLYWFEENGVRVGNGDGSSGSYFLEQFTGLNDSKGVEIYEGDIVKVVALDNDHHQRGATSNIIVAYFMSSFCLCFNGLGSGVPIFPFNVNHTLEVIGNIHENPELME